MITISVVNDEKEKSFLPINCLDIIHTKLLRKVLQVQKKHIFSSMTFSQNIYIHALKTIESTSFATFMVIN